MSIFAGKQKWRKNFIKRERKNKKWRIGERTQKRLRYVLFRGVKCEINSCLSWPDSLFAAQTIIKFAWGEFERGGYAPLNIF